MSFYLKPEAPSFHFGGGIGGMNVSAPGFDFLFADRDRLRWGKTVHVSAVYEMDRHWDLGLTVGCAYFKPEYRVAWSIRVVLMIVGY
jgi:hypothetical protein